MSMTRRLAAFLWSTICAVACGQNACLIDASTCEAGQSYINLRSCGISDADTADLQSCFTAIGRGGITFVDLGDNEVSTIPPDLFEGMESLGIIYLMGNLITSFDGVSLPSSVYHLFLQENQITSVDDVAFPASLNALRLSDNEITSIDGVAFPPSLEYLFFSRNPITSIGAGVLPAALVILSLTGISSSVAPAGAFDHLGSLKNLRRVVLLEADGCSIATIEPGAFDDLGAMIRLDLQENELETLPSQLFAAMGLLLSLDLSYNKLARLPEDAFDGLPSVNLVFLDNNALTTLPAGIFKELGSGDGGSLHLLYLHGDPDLQCIPEAYPSGESYFVYSGSSRGYSSAEVEDLPDTPGMCECSPDEAVTCAVGTTCTPGEEGYTCDEGTSSECSNGITGIDGSNDNGDVCCPIGCNQCGGAGCGSSGAADGLDNTDCCINGVLNSQDLCSIAMEAPCIVDGPDTCSSLGIDAIEGSNDNGSVCCPLGCNQCGGSGCGSSGAAEGLTNEDCCINGVLNNQGACSESGTVPCVL